MQALLSLGVVVMSLFTATLPGCSDHNQDHASAPEKKFFKCTTCLADDATRCATNTPVCGDSTERSDSETGAKDSLCDSLSPAELSRRPTPSDFKPSPYLKNACYVWPADAFKTSCSTFTAACASVPIH